MNMLWNTLRHRIWIGGGLAILTLGTAVASLTASRLQAQQDSAREQQRQADAALDRAATEELLARDRVGIENTPRSLVRELEKVRALQDPNALRKQTRNVGGEGIAVDSAFTQQITVDADRAAEAMANTIARMRTQSDASRARWAQRYRRSEAMAPDNDSEQAELLLQYAKAKRDKNAEAQQSARDRLLELTRREFAAIEEKRQAEIESIEERLAKLKAVMQERAEKAELIIELRIKRLLGEPTILDWNASSLPSGVYLDNVPMDLAAEASDDRLEALELLPAFSEGAEGDPPMVEELDEVPKVASEPDEDFAANVERLQSRLREKESQLGNVGIGMAGVYSLRRDAETAWLKAREEATKLQAEWEAMEASEKLFKEKGVAPSAEFLARRAEIDGAFQALEARGESLREASEDWRRRVEQGEATLRELQSEVDRLKGRLEQLRKEKPRLE